MINYQLFVEIANAMHPIDGFGFKTWNNLSGEHIANHTHFYAVLDSDYGRTSICLPAHMWTKLHLPQYSKIQDSNLPLCHIVRLAELRSINAKPPMNTIGHGNLWPQNRIVKKPDIFAPI